MTDNSIEQKYILWVNRLKQQITGLENELLEVTVQNQNLTARCNDLDERLTEALLSTEKLIRNAEVIEHEEEK